MTRQDYPYAAASSFAFACIEPSSFVVVGNQNYSSCLVVDWTVGALGQWMI